MKCIYRDAYDCGVCLFSWSHSGSIFKREDSCGCAPKYFHKYMPSEEDCYLDRNKAQFPYIPEDILIEYPDLKKYIKPVYYNGIDIEVKVGDKVKYRGEIKTVYDIIYKEKLDYTYVYFSQRDVDSNNGAARLDIEKINLFKVGDKVIPVKDCLKSFGEFEVGEIYPTCYKLTHPDFPLGFGFCSFDEVEAAPAKKLDSYHFRGIPDISWIDEEAFIDGKISYLLVGPKNAVFGVLRSYAQFVEAVSSGVYVRDDGEFWPTVPDNYFGGDSPYIHYIVELEGIEDVRNFIPELENVAKEIYDKQKAELEDIKTKKNTYPHTFTVESA